MSAVTAIPAAPPAEAERHFAARLAHETDAADVAAALAGGDADFTVVDVRSPEAFASGHVAGAVNLPHRRIDAASAAALPAGLLVVYCWGPGCNGAQHGARKLAAQGRQVKELLGGWEYYEREGGPAGSGAGAGSARPAAAAAGAPGPAATVEAASPGPAAAAAARS